VNRDTRFRKLSDETFNLYSPVWIETPKFEARAPSTGHGSATKGTVQLMKIRQWVVPRLPRAVVEVGVPRRPSAVKGERELLMMLVFLAPHPQRLEHFCRKRIEFQYLTIIISKSVWNHAKDFRDELTITNTSLRRTRDRKRVLQMGTSIYENIQQSTLSFDAHWEKTSFINKWVLFRTKKLRVCRRVRWKWWQAAFGSSGPGNGPLPPTFQINMKKFHPLPGMHNSIQKKN
jgi:hypothetical protein